MMPYQDEPCPEHVEALDRVLAGEKPSESLEAHIEECAACRRYSGRLAGIESLLRDAHERFGEMEPGSLAERRRPQPAKIAAWAAVLLVVAGGVAALVVDRGGAQEQQGPVVAVDATPEQGRVIMASGPGATIRRPDGTTVPAGVGSRVASWSEIVVPEEANVIVRFPSGLTIMAGASSRMVVEEATDAQHVVRLEEGTVFFRTDSPYSSPKLLVRAGDSTVEPGGRMVAVRAARSTLAEVAAITGPTRILLQSGEKLVVRGGLRMDVTTRSTSRVDEEMTRSAAALDLFLVEGFQSSLVVLSDLPATVSVDGRSIGATPLTVLLAEGRYEVGVLGEEGRMLHSEEVEIVFGREARVVVEAAMADVEPEEEVEEQKSAQPKSSVVSRIRKALAEGDTAEALALVEKHYKAHQSDAAFLSAAGDTFRRLGRYGDAVDAYLASATSGKGKSAEKAYLAAARITLEKLRDTGRAELILGSYWKSYPAGFYAQEASYLHARLLVRQKKPAQARQRLESLLASSPQSYLATKAHLLLGSILVKYMGDCAAAVPHLRAVQKAAPGGKFAEEAARFLEHCNVP